MAPYTNLDKLENPMVAEVRRGEIRESQHIGFACEVDDLGRLLHASGEPDFVTSLRSAAKPLQAIPLTTLPKTDGTDLTDEELALCCASHPGLPRHRALAASLLAHSGFPPKHLICGPMGDPPSPLQHGCSGNHAGILLTAQRMGTPLEGYERRDHPAQQLLIEIMREMAGTTEIRTATDGCGIPTFGMRIRDMARAFAALTRPNAAWERIPHVMGTNPELIGGESWTDVRLMQVTQGRLIAKTGAEGLLCIGLPGQGRGVALKVLDGSTRALGLFAIALLEQWGWITKNEVEHPLLADLRHPRLLSPNGETIGEIGLIEQHELSP